MEFNWNRTDTQKELFQEWKDFTVNFLVSSKGGTETQLLSSCLEESVGEEVPYQKMGLKSINMFLYAMKECIEVMKVDSRLFVFIRKSAIPESLIHIRSLVTAKDKDRKTKSGIIKGPKDPREFCQPEELLIASPHHAQPAVSKCGVNQRPAAVAIPQSRYSSGHLHRPQSRSSNDQQQREQKRNNLATTSRPSIAVQRSVQLTSSFSSSSTAAGYVYQPPKPSLKENVLKPFSVDSNWDSRSPPGTCPRTFMTVPSVVPTSPKLVTGTCETPPLQPKLASVYSRVPRASKSVTDQSKLINLPQADVLPGQCLSFVTKPIRTVCLDLANTIQGHGNLKYGTIRFMSHSPTIRFPAVFRGSVKANLSLKAYLATENF